MPSKQSGNTTSTQKTEPWSEQQPYYKEIFGQAQNLYNAGNLTPKAYQGDTVVARSPYSTQAIDMTATRALEGPRISGAAEDLATKTIEGDYLDITKNPGFQQGLEDIKRAYSTGTAAQTDSAAARSGAFGGSAYKELVDMNQRGFADSLNRYAGDIYNQERGRQQQALALAPTINQLGYSDYDRLAGAGAADEAYNQSKINADIEKFNIEHQAPLTALQRYQQLIGGNLGGTTTQSTPYYSNPVLSGIGGGMAGAQLGSMFGPYGTAIGAGIGGLGGLFG